MSNYWCAFFFLFLLVCVNSFFKPSLHPHVQLTKMGLGIQGSYFISMSAPATQVLLLLFSNMLYFANFLCSQFCFHLSDMQNSSLILNFAGESGWAVSWPFHHSVNRDDRLCMWGLCSAVTNLNNLVMVIETVPRLLGPRPGSWRHQGLSQLWFSRGLCSLQFEAQQ